MNQYTDQEIDHIKSINIGKVQMPPPTVGQSLFDRANNQWVAWGMTTVFNILDKTMFNIRTLNNSIDGYQYKLNEHQAKFNEINKTIKEQERRIKQLIELTPENIHIE